MQGADLHIWLNRQADRMERVLSSLALPSRVSGGRVSEGGIEYHLRPALGTEAGALMDAAGDVAARMGVKDVRATYHAGEVAMEIPRHAPGQLRLLPFMRSLGDIGELTAVVGRDMDLQPECIPLGDWSHDHLIVRGGPRTGKSELLRTLLISLALTSRPSQVNIMGVDIGGRELSVLEAIPHQQIPLATRLQSAERLIAGLHQMASRRSPASPNVPRMVCFIDDLAWLARDRSRGALGHLLGLLERGGRDGIHIFAGLRTPSMRVLRPLGGEELPPQVICMQAIESGPQYMRTFEIAKGGEPHAIQVAWLSAKDLDRAVGMLVPAGMVPKTGGSPAGRSNPTAAEEVKGWDGRNGGPDTGGAEGWEKVCG